MLTASPYCSALFCAQPKRFDARHRLLPTMIMEWPVEATPMKIFPTIGLPLLRSYKTP
jgi:hypothetical protein